MPTADARVPLSAKLAYGLGAVAYGIKDNGFQVFLLIFYNQVVGLPASRVGAAIMLALIVDAFVDPAFGVLSDRTNTRWGRRHPWLYASVVPIAISWFLLWNPPAAAQGVQFAWLVAVAIAVRIALSSNEVPSIALVPEMTSDYHERTVVLRYRYLLGWAGGLTMLTLAYAVLLANGGQAGPLAARAYRNYGLVGAAIMAGSVLVSALGTHRRYATRSTHAPDTAGLAATLGGMRRTLSNRAFLIVMAAAVFAFGNQAITFAMSNYLLTFVWRFSAATFAVYSLVLFAGVVLAFVVVGAASKRLGKRAAAASFSILASTVGLLPYWFRLAGAFPAPGSPLMLPLFLLAVGLGTAFGVGMMILAGSMVADVVEASQAETGKREEGLFAAGYFFVQKSVTGLGIFLSGLILAAVAFPERAVPGTVPEALLDRLTLTYSLLSMAFALLGARLFMRFPFGRDEHDARVAALAVASAERG